MAASRSAAASGHERKRKRQRRDSPDDYLSDNSNKEGSDTSQNAADSSSAGQSTNFRNVSACSRCRSRKNRCDQRLPSCSSCAKVGASCVGYDVITKREIPRSYVYYLECRVEELERILVSNGIAFPPASNLDLCSRKNNKSDRAKPTSSDRNGTPDYEEHPHQDHGKTLDSADCSDNQSSTGASDSSNSTSLSTHTAAAFMTLTFHTIQTSISDKNHISKDSAKRHRPSETVHSAPLTLPEKSLGLQLVRAYFNRANPQIPILQSGCFMNIFERAYSGEGNALRPREKYMLNMVFAIGSSHGFVNEQAKDMAMESSSLVPKRSKNNASPEEYYSRAIVHFDTCLKSDISSLEVLQAILLMASYSLLRPVMPGVWYIVGMAMRVAVDLGLHCEGSNPPTHAHNGTEVSKAESAEDEQVQSEQTAYTRIRELRRRLWWCTYSMDRLVSISVGRPFSISDQDISTPLPSLQEDDVETEAIYSSPGGSQDQQKSYRYITHHFIKLRLLQSDIYATTRNYEEATLNASPGKLADFKPKHAVSSNSSLESERLWLENMEKQLREWKATAPTTDVTGVAFPKAIFEFYYWQTIMLLYQRNAKIPTLIQEVKTILHDLQLSKTPVPNNDKATHRRYLKIAEAGQKVLRMYRQRHLIGCIKYTYSSALYLFSVAISYLHAVAQSSAVRRRLSPDDMDFTILAAKSIFSDMLDTCSDANLWMNAFELTAKATTKITRLYGDFGQQSQQTDWDEDEAILDAPDSTSLLPNVSTGTDAGFQSDMHPTPRPATSSYPSPEENTECWDFANESKSFDFTDDNVSALDSMLPPLSPLGSLGSSQENSETLSTSDNATSKEFLDLETIWQLDSLATEAPHLFRTMSQDHYTKENGMLPVAWMSPSQLCSPQSLARLG